jgi:hypothetical protein
LEQDVGRHDPRRHVTPPNTRSTVAFASTASGTKPHTLR